jgi:hypothetical protein
MLKVKTLYIVRTSEISKTGHKLHFWRISPFFKGSKNHFLSFGKKWCFWPKVHYDLYTRFPGSYIVLKLLKCWNTKTAKTAETAETAKTILAFWHNFGITNTNILYEFQHSFNLFNYINLLKLKKMKKTFLLTVKDLLQYFINILLYYCKFKFIIQ